MLNLITPLKVILNPPTHLEVFPGESVTLDISLINQGDQGAVIDVFVDPIAQTLLSWCPEARKRVALDSQEACEVNLLFEIPSNALPGSYPYTIVIDAPEHYPEETPIYYPARLEILVKEQAVIKSQKFTFSLNPATSPVQPLQVQPNQHQTLSVIVNNHSSRVDRFWLHCLDLDKTWFKIRYPYNELSELGIVSSTDGLELNPGGQGEIIIEFYYPINMPVGHYSPTLQLVSNNAPEQVFLDLVYLEVSPKYHLSVELETILGKVANSPGQYRLTLTNNGNSIRELAVSASSRDKTESCHYSCNPSSVNLLIGETATINLNVYPKQKWRRPFFGYGLELPFQVNLQDLQALPIPENLPMGLLVWKARPIWQFILLLLAGIGALSGLGFLIWFMFFKPAPASVLSEFRPDSTSYTEGGRVRLNWTISNADQLNQLVISSTKDQTASNPQVYDFSQGLPKELNRYCQIRERNLTCTNVDTGARLAGKYTFQLQAKTKSAQKPIEQKLDVVIQPKPLPQVENIVVQKSQLQKGKPLTLSWKINNFSQLDQLQVIGQLKDDKQENKPTVLKTYNFQKQIPPELAKQCQPPVNEILSCSNVNIELPAKPGNYAISLQPVYNGSQKQSPPSKTVQVQLKPTPIQITEFTLNNQSSEANPSIFLKVGQVVTLKWRVQGDGVKVKLEPFGDVPASGSKTFKVTTNLSQITLTAETEQGQSAKRAFLLQVDTPKPFQPQTNYSN
ncbi:hypothetical protein DSM106972_065800 [Dulcicalothrix desertica PCC 7102]|uniref:Uncharacterized protein n=1 Tax=Dulcicalothrix desertica PCC 7102 TaxID=232991 RepID=A0A433V5U5_9CYAN|nr:hypothetical protein [Dulcicalothrix desertica]RUT01483.1 hypothetical protein DSM106972_065800 [Dulcicalothrix desertica PCC 7102]TWH43480.1 hypothetical protein CAL7102_07208 [Dulcicalothrix desertica PCC 7102]